MTETEFNILECNAFVFSSFFLLPLVANKDVHTKPLFKN